MNTGKRLRIHGKPLFPKPPGKKSAPISPSAVFLFTKQSSGFDLYSKAAAYLLRHNQLLPFYGFFIYRRAVFHFNVAWSGSKSSSTVVSSMFASLKANSRAGSYLSFSIASNTNIKKNQQKQGAKNLLLCIELLQYFCHLIIYAKIFARLHFVLNPRLK